MPVPKYTKCLADFKGPHYISLKPYYYADVCLSVIRCLSNDTRFSFIKQIGVFSFKKYVFKRHEAEIKRHLKKIGRLSFNQ